MTAWCPRCQRHVRVCARQIIDHKARQKRTETLCAECRILLRAETQPLESGASR